MSEHTASPGAGADDRHENTLQVFTAGGVHGELAAGCRPPELQREVARVMDPAAAVQTISWGRNYLYTMDLELADGPQRVVVKQFRNQGWYRRLKRRVQGSKATRSWRVAQELLRAGLNTPDPVMLVESDAAEGPSFYVARWLDDVVEIRHFFRRLNGEPVPGGFPEVESLCFLEQLGGLARQLHDAGIVYRDLSLGNVLARPGGGPLPELYLVDFNRARVGRRPGVIRRSRDICRLPVLEERHRRAFLKGYWGTAPPRWSPKWWIYTASVRAYILKHALKNRLRGSGPAARVAKGGRHHAHIPAAARGAAARDKSVWDHLSDQPHQHAGRLEKLVIRAADAPEHLRELATVARVAPRVWRRYGALQGEHTRLPREVGGIGLCVRPWPQNPAVVEELVAELGVSRILLRLHPWQDQHDAEEALARRLRDLGCELAFALPQNRDLVRDRRRWRRAVAELGDRFVAFGSHFQVGQAVNRSKWGVWVQREYVELFKDAAVLLRAHPGVQLLGPAVIDFELQVTAALLNHRDPELFFDIVSSLLYVDRRGAPESPQLGFDTLGKLRLLKAIAETAARSSGRCWITEVNWPLWEGPHSPAGRTVAVDEETQADYLVRYYLIALTSGFVERVYWWQLVARGYGLVAPSGDGGLRRRPAFSAFQTLLALVEGTRLEEILDAPDGAQLYRFSSGRGAMCVGWSARGKVEVELPWPAAAVIDRDGREGAPARSPRVALDASPRYFMA